MLHCIRDGSHDMELSTRGFSARMPAHNYVINIKPLGTAGPKVTDFHPRYLGHGIAA